MKPKRAPDPVLPGSTTDRTGTSGILRRAGADIRRRWAAIQRDALAAFGQVRILGLNDSVVGRTVYALTPDEMSAVSQALRAALDSHISSGREQAHMSWWSQYTAEAAQLGAAQSVSNLSRLSATYAATRTLREVVASAAYRDRLGTAHVKSYDHWTGLAAETRAELSSVIGRAVADGKSPKTARAEIAEKLSVSRSRAMQYAQTDITDTLRQSRMAEAEHAEAEFGLRIGLLWTSALIPTTRPWHASRNGKVYTGEQVRAFYDERGNRYRCHCAATECLLDDGGRPVLSDRLRQGMAAELAAWKPAKA